MDRTVASSSSHTYRNTTISDQAHAHLGNNYNYNHNHNYFHTGSQDEKIRCAILDSLRFEGFDRRSERLSSESRENYHWILSNEPSPLLAINEYSIDLQQWNQREEARQSLKDWLSDEQSSLFWVTGKPASGKSTFVKAIKEHADLDHLLYETTANEKRIVAEHYFWLAGEPMQRSFRGLFQSLLHEIISALVVEHDEDLDLLKTICGARWTSTGRGRQWVYLELKAALFRACKCTNKKFAFFIDGLDECDEQDHGLLVSDILELGAFASVKVLVSSRTWLLFAQKLGHAPQLQMENITLCEMCAYAWNQMMEAEFVLQNRHEFRDRSREAQQLISEVVRRAEGVFLWTALVLKALASEVRKGRPTCSLLGLLREQPDGLDAYFRQRIYERICQTRRNKIATANALKLLLVLQNEGLHQFRGSSHTAFSLLCRGLLFGPASTFDILPYTGEERVRQESDVASFLQETCGDLVIVTRSSQWLNERVGKPSVNVIHRSAFDFLEQDNIASFIESNCSEQFKEHGFMHRVGALCIKDSMSQTDLRCTQVTHLVLHALQGCHDNCDFFEIDGKKQLEQRCEGFVIDHLSTSCTGSSEFTYRVNHWNTEISHEMFQRQLCLYSLAVWRAHPHVIPRGDKPVHLNIWLGMASHGGTRSESLHLPHLLCLLELGCEPDVTRRLDSGCEVSIWEEFLRIWVIPPEVIDPYPDSAKTVPARVYAIRDEDHAQKIPKMIMAMLESGANPHCNPCLAPEPGPYYRRPSPSPHNHQLSLSQIVLLYLPERWRPDILAKIACVSTGPARSFRFKRQKLRSLSAFRSQTAVLDPASSFYHTYLTVKFVEFLNFWIPQFCSDVYRWNPLFCDSCHSPVRSGIRSCLDCMDFPPICRTCLKDESSPHRYHLLMDLVWDQGVPSWGFDISSVTCLHNLLLTLYTWFDLNAEAHGVADHPATGRLTGLKLSRDELVRDNYMC